jgi:putative phosphoesterase
MRVGVISDTHGLLRPQALQALHGADLLVHAGDIGTREVLDGLRSRAPVIAVRGNNDRGAWAQAVPQTDTFEAAGAIIHLLHDLSELDLDPEGAGLHAVISGHSHRPRIERRQGVLYLNPGSAGPRRFRLPVSVAWLEIEAGQLQARIIELYVASG